MLAGNRTRARALEVLLRGNTNAMFSPVGKHAMKGFFLPLLFLLAAIHPLFAAETLDSLIAGAKKESEFTFIAGAQTFALRVRNSCDSAGKD